MDTINNSISTALANLFWLEGNNQNNSNKLRSKMTTLFYGVISNKDLAIVELNDDGQIDRIYKICECNQFIATGVDNKGIKKEFIICQQLVPIWNDAKVIGKRIGIVDKQNALMRIGGKMNKMPLYDIATVN